MGEINSQDVFYESDNPQQQLQQLEQEQQQPEQQQPEQQQKQQQLGIVQTNGLNDYQTRTNSENTDSNFEQYQEEQLPLYPLNSIGKIDDASYTPSPAIYTRGNSNNINGPYYDDNYQENNIIDNNNDWTSTSDYNLVDDHVDYANTALLASPIDASQALYRDEEETVQYRVEQWRAKQLADQQQKYQLDDGTSNSSILSSSTISTRPTTGVSVSHRPTTNLLTSVSRGSRAMIFFIVMWRNVHLYEVADLAFRSKPLVRFLIATPLSILFLSNLLGAIVSLTSSPSTTTSTTTKKRLKAILNLDKFVEILLIVYYFLRLIITPSTSDAPRELYIGYILHSVFFILHCQTFTKLSWNENQHPLPSVTPSSYPITDASEGGVFSATSPESYTSQNKIQSF